MQLNSFLQLTQDLNSNYLLYYRPAKKNKFYPITKATISAQECVFETKNEHPKSLAEIQKVLAHIHQNKIDLFINHQNRKNFIYGIQIDLVQKKIYLL